MVGYIEIVVIPLHTMQLALLDDIESTDSVSKERLRHHEYLFPLKYAVETSSGDERVRASRQKGLKEECPSQIWANQIVSISLQIMPYKTLTLERAEQLIRQMLMVIAGSLSNHTRGKKNQSLLKKQTNKQTHIKYVCM